MNKSMVESSFKFPKQKSYYKGKVRDVYNIDDELLIMIVSDRISAYDHVLSTGIPYKGQVLNQIAAKFLDATSDIIKNWKIATPDPMVTIGHVCKPYPVEMIVRGYLTGSSWRSYKNGSRKICGVKIPDGMKEHQKFDTPILTPTTKAEQGEHDEDITREEIISSNLITEVEYMKLEKYSLELFQRGTEIAAEKDLILVDTKYEFGKKNGEIYLIDEIHTPDSSRYFYANGYEERQKKGENQKQLSKEFVREWLAEQGFQGKEEQKLPAISNEFANQVSERYIELYEKIIGEKFVKTDIENITNRIEKNILKFLA